MMNGGVVSLMLLKHVPMDHKWITTSMNSKSGSYKRSLFLCLTV